MSTQKVEPKRNLQNRKSPKSRLTVDAGGPAVAGSELDLQLGIQFT
jgi:hypothetical protein